MGLSVAHRKISAFGGLLHTIGAYAHTLTTNGSDITHTGQNSRLDVGDIDLLEADRRLKWKTYSLVYSLLDEIFSEEHLPDLILLDVPLIMGRAVHAQILDDIETDTKLINELTELRNRLEGFWEKNINRCFPFSPDGPKVITLDRGRFGSLLRLIKAKGQEVSPDPIDADVEKKIKSEWTKVLSVGIDRVLRGILIPEHRTAAFDVEQNLDDKRLFPQALLKKGTIGFHYLTGLRGRPIQVEALGATSLWRDIGGTEALDELAADLIAVTYFDHRNSVPLSLWYAQQAVEIIKKKGLLEFYKLETIRAMRDEDVDLAWLAGWGEE
jgi:hypothetical protein